jgi:hypothetical protein
MFSFGVLLVGNANAHGTYDVVPYVLASSSELTGLTQASHFFRESHFATGGMVCVAEAVMTSKDQPYVVSTRLLRDAHRHRCCAR